MICKEKLNQVPLKKKILLNMHWPLGLLMIDLLMYRKQPGCGLMRWNYG